jgi:hypothetical protein
MKDELPEQLEPQTQDASTDNLNAFGDVNNKPTEPFVASAPTTSVKPLAESEVEPSTSDIASTGETPKSETPASFSEQSASSATPFGQRIADPTASGPNQPLTSATPPAFGGTLAPAKKSNRKKFIIIGVVAGVLALLIGGSVAAYNLWYQNPDKVLGDALVNTLKAKTVVYTGSFDIDYKAKESSFEPSDQATRVSVKVDGKSATTAGEVNIAVETTFEGKEYKISGSGLVDKDANIFVKVNDVKKLLSSLPDESGVKYDQLPSYITDIVDKVDSKWIRISADDIREFSDDYAKKQTCVEDVFKKLQDDKEFGNELLKVYKDNKFIVVDEKLPAKNGSLGYVIDVDKSKSKDFAKAADKTKFAKELQKCDDSFKFSSSSSSSSSNDSDTKTRVEVWVDRWSHQLTKVSFTAEGDEADGMFVFEPQFNQPITVEAPKDFIPLKELKKDIEEAYAQYMSSALGDYNAIRRRAAIDSYKANNQGKQPTETEIQQLLKGDSASTERTI